MKVKQGEKIMEGKGKLISCLINYGLSVWLIWNTILVIVHAEIEPVDDTANTLPPVSCFQICRCLQKSA